MKTKIETTIGYLFVLLIFANLVWGNKIEIYAGIFFLCFIQIFILIFKVSGSKTGKIDDSLFVIKITWRASLKSSDLFMIILFSAMIVSLINASLKVDEGFTFSNPEFADALLIIGAWVYILLTTLSDSMDRNYLLRFNGNEIRVFDGEQFKFYLYNDAKDKMTFENSTIRFADIQNAPLFEMKQVVFNRSKFKELQN